MTGCCWLPQVCTVANLLSKKGNPHTATGALLEQSAFTDALSSNHASNNSRVAPEYNAGFTGVPALRLPNFTHALALHCGS